MILMLVVATNPSPNVMVESLPWHIKELFPIIQEPLKIISPPPLSYVNTIIWIHMATETS